MNDRFDRQVPQRRWMANGRLTLELAIERALGRRVVWGRFMPFAHLLRSKIHRGLLRTGFGHERSSQSAGERLPMSDELPFDEATAPDDLSDEPASFSSAVSSVGSRQFAPDLERIPGAIHRSVKTSNTCNPA